MLRSTSFNPLDHHFQLLRRKLAEVRLVGGLFLNHQAAGRVSGENRRTAGAAVQGILISGQVELLDALRRSMAGAAPSLKHRPDGGSEGQFAARWSRQGRRCWGQLVDKALA